MRGLRAPWSVSLGLEQCIGGQREPHTLLDVPGRGWGGPGRDIAVFFLGGGCIMFNL